MNTATSYRCRQTGNILRAGDLSGRKLISRWKPPVFIQNGEEVQPKLNFIIPAANELDFDQFLFDVADVDPIYPADRPEYDKFTQTLTLADPLVKDGLLTQNWIISERYDSFNDLKAACIERINNLADQKRDGGITYSGIPIKTNTAGIALIIGAKLAGADKYDFVVGEDVHELNKTQIEEIFTQVHTHVQSTYSDRGRLIGLVKNSNRPSTVDLSDIE